MLALVAVPYRQNTWALRLQDDMLEEPEAFQVRPGLFVVATATRFRLYRPSLFEGSAIVETVACRASEALTRQSMAGAFYAGMSESWPVATPPAQEAPASVLLRHIHRLAANYQTTSATPPVMRQVAERLGDCGRQVAAAHCRQVAEEEAGHDTLALMDLAALGLPARQLVERLKPKNAVALVDLFRSMAGSDAPISTLGYAYGLERAALFTKVAAIEAIDAAMPPGVLATRCLRVHSAVGGDSGHVAESVALISTLPPNDRAAVARATYATGRLMYGEPDDYPGDAAMRALLRDVGWTHSAAQD
jgi:hypothetical protein